MAMELLEKGRVRFWTQVEKCTSACQVDYVFNDVIITQGKVGIKSNLSILVISSHIDWSLDKADFTALLYLLYIRILLSSHIM